MRRIGLFIFMAAFLPRLLVAVFSTDIPRYDADNYDQKALSILSGKGFSVQGSPTSSKPPLYPFFLAAVYSLFGHHYMAIRIVQAFLGALSCLFVFWTAKTVLTEPVAVLAGFLSGLNPVFIKSTEHLLTECLFTFLLAGGVFFLVRGKERRRLRDFVLSGFLLGLASLTRPSLLGFPLFLALLGVLGWGWKGDALSFRLKRFLVLGVVFLLTLFPWGIRNWNVHKTVVLVSTDGGRAFYASYRPPEGRLFGFNATDEVSREAEKISSEVAQDRFLFRETLRFIQDHPRILLKLTLLKFLFFWVPFDWEILGGGIYNAFYGFFILFAIGAMVLHRNSERLTMLLALIFYFQITSLIFYGSPRFRMPIEPFLIIFASEGLVYFFNRSRNKVIPISVFAGYFFFHGLLFLCSSSLKGRVAQFLSGVGIWQ